MAVRKSQQKVVKVFISSTFSEFEAERRVLVGTVFPRLRERFSARGVSIVAVDLRWGLEQVQIEDLGLVDACLGQVVECEPYFLGLIGSRYGTTVRREELVTSKILNTYRLFDDLPESVSITELEFDLGALARGNEYALFFSKAVLGEADDGVRRLIGRLDGVGSRLNDYASLEHFEESAYQKLSEIVDARFPETNESLDPVAAAQQATLATHLEGYVPGNTVVEEALDRLGRGESVYIQGQKGVGKSAAFSYCVDSLAGDGTNDFVYFCNTGFCFEDAALFKKIAEHFERQYGASFDLLPQDGFPEILGKLSAGLRDLVFDGPVYLCVDAIEQLRSTRNLWSVLRSLCEQNPNLVCLATGTQDFSPNDDCLELHGLEEGQVKRIVAEELQKSGKILRPELVEMVERSPYARSPLMLKGVLNELGVVGRFEGLERQIESFCSLNSPADLLARVVERVKEETLGMGLDHEPVMRAVGFLAGVHYGASEDELADATGIPPLVWASLRYALKPFLVSYDGRMKLNHQLVERAASDFAGQAGISHEAIALRAVEVYKRPPATVPRIFELASWASKTGSLDVLAGIVVDPDNFNALLTGDPDSLRLYLSALSRDEGPMRPMLLSFLEANGFDPRVAEDLCGALARSGCMACCIFVVEQFEFRGMATSDLLRLKARAIYQVGDYRDVGECFSQAWAKMVEEGREQTEAAVTALIQQAIALKSCGQGRMALQKARQACKIADELGICSNDAIWSKMFRARLEYGLGTGYASIDVFDDILAMQRRLSGEQSYPYYRLICYQWQAYLQSGQIQKADRFTAACLDGLQRTSGESPDYAWALTNRSSLLACVGRYEESRRLMAESRRINDLASGGGMHAYSVTSVLNDVLMAMLQQCGARPADELRDELVSKLDVLHRQALSIHDGSHPYVLNILADRALARLKLGGSQAEVLEACDELRSIAARMEEALEGDNPDSVYLCACAWMCDGRADKDVLVSRYQKMGVGDYVTAAILKSGDRPDLRLATNNGAALYLVP